MYRPLVPCPACARHVLASETACPFCAASLPSNLAERAIPSAPTRLNRAAAFVFGASLAVTGCSSETTGGGTTGMSGGAQEDAGLDDDGGVMPLYGGPPVDGGPDDDGGGMAEYGAPPPPDDAGTDAGDGGGAAPLYGAPPMP